MNRTFRTVMSWMGLLVVIFLAWHFVRFERREEGIVFSELLARVDAGEVGSAAWPPWCCNNGAVCTA